jgi:hypothetical protein
LPQLRERGEGERKGKRGDVREEKKIEERAA